MSEIQLKALRVVVNESTTKQFKELQKLAISFNKIICFKERFHMGFGRGVGATVVGALVGSYEVGAGVGAPQSASCVTPHDVDSHG